jgi:hypothetical protein
MMDAFQVRIFLPDRLAAESGAIDRMKRAAASLPFPRGKWSDIKQRGEFRGAGVFVVCGHPEDAPEGVANVALGTACEDICAAIDQQTGRLASWVIGVAVLLPRGQLSSTQLRWLEYALVEHADRSGGCYVGCKRPLIEPVLRPHEKACVRAILQKLLKLQVFPGTSVFKMARTLFPDARDSAASEDIHRDTIVVPAHADGFKAVFLGENAWYSIRIAQGMLQRIRYIAAYQTAPIGAITHFARIARIEPHGRQKGRYRLVFAGPAIPIGPIPFGNAPPGSMQGPRYTSFLKLQKAKTLLELLK